MLWKIAAVGAVALVLGWIIYTQVVKRQQAPLAAAATAQEETTTAKDSKTPAATTKEGVVYELEDTDLANFTQDGTAVVLFYAPWCGYCKKMFPEFAQAATTSEAANCRWGQVDATKFEQLAKKFNVEAFPTTIVFQRGEVKQVVPGAQSASALRKIVE